MKQTRFSLGVLLAVVLLVGSSLTHAGGEQPPKKSERDLDNEIAALQLSQMCSASAGAFWRQHGYDRPSSPATKGTTESWSYRSHYNASQKRCFVLIELLTQRPNGSSTKYQEVYDANEGGQPLGAMNIHQPSNVPGMPAMVTLLLKANSDVPATTENIKWFWELMST